MYCNVMPAGVENLAHDIVNAYQCHSSDTRLLVGIAGPPGSGKSTLIVPLTLRVNALLRERGYPTIQAICVGLDGWHYRRAELDRMPDPIEAHRRRGAPFTFNIDSYRAFLELLTQSISHNTAPIPYPTFDHALKDPLMAPTPITSSDRIVLIEGLYTLLDLPGWRDCAERMDIRVWIEVAEVTARHRIIERNYRAGITDSLETCAERVDSVDMENGKLVRKFSMAPTHVLVSIDEPTIETADRERHRES